MKTRAILPTLGIVIVAAIFLAGAARLQAVRERGSWLRADDEEVLYVTSGSAVRRLSGAYSALAADMYWVRAIQYYGGAKRRLATAKQLESPSAVATTDHQEYRQLYPLLDLATSLDPRFTIAYRFGAVFLAEAYPGGAGRPDLAVKLLEKGWRAQPDKWQYMEDIGFVHYWYRHDFHAAAAAFDQAARVPGAPWWLKPLAATTLAGGGDRRSSRLMWEAIRQSAENDWLRTDAERSLLQLQALDQLDSLQASVDAFMKRAGTAPAGWTPLARANGWPGAPVDPTGVPYDLTPEGRVQLSRRSTLFPLPEEPQKLDTGRPPS